VHEHRHPRQGAQCLGLTRTEAFATAGGRHEGGRPA
jgi:hypothetical protein